MNVTLNDFRAVLGRINDGNIVFKGPAGQEKLGKVNYGWNNKEATDSDPEMNRKVREAFLTALSNSPEAKVLREETMQRIRAYLGLNPGDQVGDTKLERRTIVEIFHLVDQEANAEALKRQVFDAYRSRGVERHGDGIQLLFRANEIAQNDLFKSPESMIAGLSTRYNGFDKKALTRLCRDNFAVIKALVYESAFGHLTDRQDHGQDLNVDPVKILRAVVTHVMGHFAKGQDIVLPSATLPQPAAVPEIPEGDARQLYKDSGVEAYEQNLDKILAHYDKSNSYAANMMRSFMPSLRADMRRAFLAVANTAQGELEKKRESIRKDFLTGAVVARMRLIASLAHDIGIAGNESLGRRLGWKLCGLLENTRAGVTDAAALTGRFFTTLGAVQGTLTIRGQFTAMIEKYYSGCTDEVRQMLLDNMEKLLAASEKGVAPEMKALSRFYDECLMETAKHPDAEDRLLLRHVKFNCDKLLKEKEAERLAKNGEEGVIGLEAQGLGDQFAPHYPQHAHDTKEQCRKFGLEMLAVAAFSMTDEEAAALTERQLLDLLLAEPKSRREALVPYVRFGLASIDHTIASSTGGTHKTPIRDLLYDGFINPRELDARSAELLGGILEGSLTGKGVTLDKLGSKNDTQAMIDHFEPILRKLGVKIDPQFDGLRAAIPLQENPVARQALLQGMVASLGIDFPGFPVTDAAALFAAFRDVGITFADLKTMRGRETLVTLCKLSRLNPDGAKGLDEFALRLTGKHAKDLTYEDVHKLSDPLVDPLDALKGAERETVQVLTGAKGLKESAASFAEIAELRRQLRGLEHAVPGTSVNVKLAGVPVTLALRASGELTGTVAGQVFHISETAYNLRAACEDRLVADADKPENAATLRAVLDDNGPDAAPLLRRRELCTKIIARRTGAPGVTLAQVKTEDLETLARAVLAGEKGLNDLPKEAPQAYNSIDMVEMHEAMVEMERAEAGSVSKKVKINASSDAPTDARTLDERRAATRDVDVRNLAADLLMNRDTWALDESALKGKPVVPGARLQALVREYAPELHNILVNENDPEAQVKLLAALPPVAGEKLADIIRRLAAVQDPENAEALKTFAAIERELDTVAETAMADLQAKVTGFFGAKAADDTPLWQKSFDELAGATGLDLSTASGRFAKKILDGYFTLSARLDQRKMFAAVLRNVTPADNDTKVVTELLKGAGPLLQKLLQGLPEASFDKATRTALADMKSRLPTIAPEAIKAQLLELVRSSNGEILSIEVKKSLGAASVGQALLCVVRTKDRPDSGLECVIKVLRPMAQMSVQREKALFDKLADPAERTAYDQQYRSILTELDFTLEAANVDLGTHVYERPTVDGNVDNEFHSMSRVPITRPTMGTMMLRKAPGKTVDGYLRDICHTVDDLLDRGDPPVRRPAAVAPGQPSKTVYVTGTGGIYALRKEINARRAELLTRRTKIEHLVKAWFEQSVFKDGFFHGDLHAGNVMTDLTGLTVIDFGNCGRLTKDEHDLILKLLCLSITKDEKAFVNTFREALDPQGKDALDAALAALGSTLLADVKAVLEKGYSSDALSRIQGAFTVLQRANVALPGRLSSFFQSFARLGGILESMDDLLRELDDISLQLQPEPPPETPVYASLLEKVPVLKDLDGLAQLIGGKPGTRPDAEDVKKLLEKITTSASWNEMRNGNDDYVKNGARLAALTKEERDLLVATLERHMAGLPANDPGLPGLQVVKELFAKLDTGAALTPAELGQLDRNFASGCVNAIKGDSNIYEFVEPDVDSFDEIVNGIVYDHQKDLMSFALNAFSFRAIGIGAKMSGEEEVSNDHKNRVAGARVVMRSTNENAGADRLSAPELTKIEQAVTHFCRPLSVPFASKGWVKDDAKVRDFLQTLEANRRHLVAAIPGAGPQHLKSAFTLFSDSEGPQGGKKGPTWLGALAALTPEDRAVLENKARELFPETAPALIELIGVL